MLDGHKLDQNFKNINFPYIVATQYEHHTSMFIYNTTVYDYINVALNVAKTVCVIIHQHITCTSPHQIVFKKNLK